MARRVPVGGRGRSHKGVLGAPELRLVARFDALGVDAGVLLTDPDPALHALMEARVDLAEQCVVEHRQALAVEIIEELARRLPGG